MFGIKKLIEENKNLKKRMEKIECKLDSEALCRSAMKQGFDFRIQNIINRIREQGKSEHTRNHFIEKLSGFTGVTKLEMETGDKIKLKFDKPTTLIIID